jgi:hypothetical protein
VNERPTGFIISQLKQILADPALPIEARLKASAQLIKCTDRRPRRTKKDVHAEKMAKLAKQNRATYHDSGLGDLMSRVTEQ